MNSADLDELLERIESLPISGKRRVVAIAGPPASGKSWLAAQVSKRLKHAVTVPMDGYHLDNRVLEDRGLLARKGAPETFDLGGFASLVKRLKQEEEIFFPLFDRARDLAIAGAGLVGRDCKSVIVEGNYLLYDRPGWRSLDRFWDLRVFLRPSETVLRERLIDRWLRHGLDRPAAIARAQDNDLPNARAVSSNLTRLDVEISSA